MMTESRRDLIKDPREYVPLKELSWYILMSIYAEPKHGQAILEDIRRLSLNFVRPEGGNLYVALQRLADKGLIVPQEIEDLQPRQRKPYDITDFGREVFSLNLEFKAHTVEVGRRIAAAHF